MYDIWVIKILPFVLIPVLILAALGYWRFVYLPRSALTTPAQKIEPSEVPKTLPVSEGDDKLTSLEQSVKSLAGEVDKLKSAKEAPNSDTRIANVESAILELKARVSALEKATPAPVTSTSQSAVYIPLGSGGGPWANQDWYTTPEYQIKLDPANYPGYSGMYLEVTFRLAEAVGTGSVRLYNSTDGSSTSSQLDTISTSFGLFTSSSFKLPTASKNYALQIKSTEGKNLFIQTARIRVNF